MKNVSLAVGILGAVTLSAVAALANTKAAAPDVLFVGKLEGRSVSDHEAETIESSVCTAATQDTRFTVRCRDTSKGVADIRKLQAELGFPEGDPTKDNCGKEGCMGALTAAGDAKWALVGSISKVAEKQYMLTLQVVEPKSLTQINRVEEKVSGDLSIVVDRVPGAVRKVLTPPQKK